MWGCLPKLARLACCVRFVAAGVVGVVGVVGLVGAKGEGWVEK